MVIRRKWGSRALQLDRSYLSDTSMPEDQGRIYTIPFPAGRSVDSVRLYAYHDIYGTIPFNSAEDLEDFYSSSGDILRVDPDNGHLIEGPNFDRPYYRPAGMAVNWDQPLDNTAVEIFCPFFKVFNEFSYHILEIHFNDGGSQGGGNNYAQLIVQPDTTTGSPNQNELTFILKYVNYGVTQDTDSVNDLRKYPDHTGEDVGYRLKFYLDEDTDTAMVDILGDYSGASETTLSVTSPAGVDYCDDHHLRLFSFFADPDDTTTARTAIDYFKILKGDDEGNRIIYELSRDGGSNWAVKEGDSWFTSGYNKTDIDLSGQGAGDGELLLKVKLRWPALLKGLGLSWEG